MEITRGKIAHAKKVIVYGPEGIGKSTFASKFPEPLFIDTEGSTKEMNISRLPEPSSWEMILEEIAYVKANPDICRTLVIDTIDWAEAMCIEHVCSKHQKDGLESFGYGSGYIYEKEEFGRFLNRLEEIVKAGIHVVLTAHAQMRKFEQPDEMGAYDRWELKLGKKTTSQISPLIKEWADIVLFANYKTYSVAVDDKGKKHKAQGGSRVMYTAHHPCWDAKNRYGLPEEMPFDYAGISDLFGTAGSPATHGQQDAESMQHGEPSKKERREPAGQLPTDSGNEKSAPKTDIGKLITESNPDNLPRALKDLMIEHSVSEWDIQNAVASKGYYTSDTPVEKYDPGFIQGVLVGAWQQVYRMIQEIRDKMEIPFQ